VQQKSVAKPKIVNPIVGYVVCLHFVFRVEKQMKNWFHFSWVTKIFGLQ
jgi:hypothetical protein